MLPPLATERRPSEISADASPSARRYRRAMRCTSDGPADLRLRRWGLLFLMLQAAGAACGGSSAAPPPSIGADPGGAPAPAPGPEDAATDAPPGAGDAPLPPAAAQPAPGQPMSRSDAQRYVLALVNRDRAAHKLPPVV